MFVLPKSNKKASARAQIAIEGVRDGVLKLPHDRYRRILQVSSINFELKSEAEQDALIDIYESFLHSIDCPLQILIRTREIDLDKYLDELTERLSGETEPIYQTQLTHYSEFIRSLVATNKILTRNFYVVIPYDAKGAEFAVVQEQLGLRVDIVGKGLARLGMQSRELTSLEILDLFYAFYSPTQAKIQPLSDHALQALHTLYLQKEMI